jgi:hypothetical protein
VPNIKNDKKRKRGRTLTGPKKEQGIIPVELKQQ